MSWDWVGALVVGAVAGSLFAWLAAAYHRETQRLKLARAQVAEARQRRQPN